MIGLDIAKHVFQAHGEDGEGRVVMRKRLRRGQVEAFFAGLAPLRIGIEACGSAHHWGRVLSAQGHEVRLIPARYVKPFVRRSKTDAHDAAAICAALGRADMRFVAIKSVERQASRGLERSRDLLVKQHTQLVNAVRGQMAEMGIVSAQGMRGFAALAARIDAGDAAIPPSLLAALRALAAQARGLSEAAAALERRIVAAAKADPAMRLLTTVPGIGWLSAHAIVSAIGDGRQFRSARDFAAWTGLTPQEHASAGRRRRKGISRQGDAHVRRRLVLGASTVMRHARIRPERASAWQRGILARRPVKVAVVAQAAKTARIAFAVLVKAEPYRAAPAAP